MKLFGTAGIRKKYPEKLDPTLAFKLGVVVAGLEDWGRGFIVYDTRTTNHLFTYSFASGLLAGGLDAHIVGLAPTPIAGYVAMKYKGLGVSVTASHNPPEYNGFKFYDREGYEFTRDREKIIEERIDRRIELVGWENVGRIYHRGEIVEEYVSDMIHMFEEIRKKWEPIIAVDTANGAAYNITPRIIRELGAKPLTVNSHPDGFFPIRSPEPRKDVLEKYLDLYGSVNPPVIFAHDGDADRLAVLDPVKGFIRQDRIIAFYAYLLLSEKKGKVIVSVDTGRVVDEVVERFGGSLERYVLGKTHERVKELGKKNIVLAAEPWKLIDPRWGPWVDGIWQVALITKEIVERGKPFIKILDDLGIPDYPWDRRSYKIMPENLRDKIYYELVEELSNLLGEPVNILSIDGYRFEYEDGSWVLVRKSGTEPKIRVYAEAKEKDRLRNMMVKFENILLYITKKNNAVIAEKTVG